MYIFLQILSTMTILDPISLSHVVSTLFASTPPPPSTQKMIPRTRYPDHELLIFCQAFELHD